MTRGEQRLARGLTAGGRERRLSAAPRPSWWPPLARIEAWTRLAHENVWRSVSAGKTRFSVRASGSSWLAHEMVITDDGRGLGWVRLIGSFLTPESAKRQCERLASANSGIDSGEQRVCSKCGEGKPLEAFGHDRRSRGGRRACCKHCERLARPRKINVWAPA